MIFLNFIRNFHPELVTPNGDVDPVNVTSEIATEFFGNVSVARNKVLQPRKQLSYQQVAGYKAIYLCSCLGA